MAARTLAIAWALCLSACAGAAPDTILLNGRFFTANPSQPWAQAIAIRGDRIVAVGDTDVVAAAAASSTRRIDVGGRTVIPGLIDAHVEIGSASSGGVRSHAIDAAGLGVTSMHVFSIDRPVADSASAIAAAGISQRVRLYRMPVPDEATGEHRDSRPHFPPQPSPRLDVRGMGFALAADQSARLSQAVGWAYGSEDPIVMQCRSAQEIDSYVAALKARGAAPVWRAKRPRLETPIAVSQPSRATLVELGAVVSLLPGPDSDPQALVDSGIPIALGSLGHAAGLALVRWASEELAPPLRISRERAVEAATRGGAYAELSDDEKGQLAVGMLADLAVLSADVFSVAPADMGRITSVLTMVGGRIVHRTGVVQ